MLRTLVLISTAVLVACVAQRPYTWQDIRSPARADAQPDLAECTSYAARQYQPGKPKGEPYQQKTSEAVADSVNDSAQEWRADRTPFPTTGIHSQSVHDVPVDYTGYPGELDYSPGYLDDILEKCMLDRGWVFEKSKD